jgi:hypothetical protein
MKHVCRRRVKRGIRKRVEGPVRNDEGIKELVGTEGGINCTHGNQGVEGRVGVKE